MTSSATRGARNTTRARARGARATPPGSGAARPPGPPGGGDVHRPKRRPDWPHAPCGRGCHHRPRYRSLERLLRDGRHPLRPLGARGHPGQALEGARMTELQKLYLAERAGGKKGHHGALRAIARTTGIDEATLDRCLKRARRTDVLEEKRAKKDA